MLRTPGRSLRGRPGVLVPTSGIRAGHRALNLSKDLWIEPMLVRGRAGVVGPDDPAVVHGEPRRRLRRPEGDPSGTTAVQLRQILGCQLGVRLVPAGQWHSTRSAATSATTAVRMSIMDSTQMSSLGRGRLRTVIRGSDQR